MDPNNNNNPLANVSPESLSPDGNLRTLQMMRDTKAKGLLIDPGAFKARMMAAKAMRASLAIQFLTSPLFEAAAQVGHEAVADEALEMAEVFAQRSQDRPLPGFEGLTDEGRRRMSESDEPLQTTVVSVLSPWTSSSQRSTRTSTSPTPNPTPKTDELPP